MTQATQLPPAEFEYDHSEVRPAVSRATLLRLFIAVDACIVLGIVAYVLFSGQRMPQRVVNDSVRLPLSPPSRSAWKAEKVFPHLKFFEPTCIVQARDGSRRVLVLERRGTVQLIAGDSEAKEKTQVLDISRHVIRTPYEDDGAYGLVLHPEFGRADSANRAYFYLMYTADVDGTRYDRLSRFTLDGQSAGDETVLIEQLDENLWHNGGGLAFGSDGFLYVGVGDEGTDGDGLSNGQRIDRDLFCGILRIDVDMRVGDVSHSPRRQPETGKTAHYLIPKDNPFVGVPGALAEFWCHGLRNPYRIAFDPQTGLLWAGDVGHLSREEINIIRPGGNYGWSYAEGTLPFTDSYLNGQKPATYHGTEYPPLLEYAHVNGNRCVIGGFVYRGTQLPGLEGKYLYADNGSGRVWALESDGQTVTGNTELFAFPDADKTGISSIEPDADGEPWIVVLGAADREAGTIHRIVPADPDETSPLPQRLSETGIFLDVKNLTPHDGVIPYAVNAGQAALGTEIRRWIILPGDGTDRDAAVDRIGFDADGPWTFPTGTVLVQHFELPAEKSPTGLARRLETRVLRIVAGGAYGASYRWNDDGSDAVLVESPELLTVQHILHGEQQTIQWQLAGGDSCIACHNANAGYVLGVNSLQINRDHPYGLIRRPLDQLREWNRVGMFRIDLDDESIDSAGRLVSPGDELADLDARTRSFLDVNCAACHRPGGARSHLDARFAQTDDTAPLDLKPQQGDFGLLDGRIVAPGDPYRSVLYYRLAKLGPGRMPLAGSKSVGSEQMELLKRWIEQLPASPVSAEIADRRRAQAEVIERIVQGAVPEEELPVVLHELFTDTSGAFQLWQQLQDEAVEQPVRDQIVAVAVASPQQPVRDLYERFVPADQRTQRLGPEFAALDVLRLAGDARRGREIYLNMEGLTCRNCHALESGRELIGPSLSGVAARYDRRQILTHIVDPTLRIEDKYRAWTVVDGNGRVATGLKIEESADALVLKDANGHQHRFTKDDVDEIVPQENSLMPARLLQGLTAQDAADLLAFLATLK